MYAPTVLSEAENAVLDVVGAYVARRGPVADALPDGALTDRKASDRARTIHSAASRHYVLVGSPETVREQVDALWEAGDDLVIGYPARGLGEFLG